MNKIPVAILGATGPVGQKVISLLEDHPRFFVAELAASEGRAGKRYGDSVAWKNEYPLPKRVADLLLRPMLEVQSECVISALPTEVALEIEPALSARGHLVSSNAAAFRMAKDVPLLIPEVNSSHLSLLKDQARAGRIVTNPNCSTVFLTSALRPFEHVSVVTMQALSGAGYPGVASFDLLGNVIPHIGGEEAKIEEETKRILGTPTTPAPFDLTVHVHRVPVVHGHTIAAHVRFKKEVSVKKAREAFLAWQEREPNFLAFHEEIDRPQPARDLNPHEMRTHVGRLKQGGDPRVIGFISLGHNLVRGAAGAAIANLTAVLDQRER
ncbi:MAG: aspartate-semialdehyde dehydrogenase [Proteobacteria bacterium]|nr:MAG: aspartate-semialdehyde dehydrogenase [Pseudomonadota bacterium]